MGHLRRTMTSPKRVQDQEARAFFHEAEAVIVHDLVFPVNPSENRPAGETSAEDTGQLEGVGGKRLALDGFQERGEVDQVSLAARDDDSPLTLHRLGHAVEPREV